MFFNLYKLLKLKIVKFDKKLQVFTLFFCFFNTKFDFWWWLWQPFLSTTNLPLHDVPVGKSPTYSGWTLFVYVGHDSRTPFYDYDNYLYVYLYVFRTYSAPIYLYVYRWCCPLYMSSLPTLLPPPFTCLPFKLHLYSPQSISAYDLRGETGATLFRLSCLSYIRILILIWPTYRCRCGTPGWSGSYAVI